MRLDSAIGSVASSATPKISPMKTVEEFSYKDPELEHARLKILVRLSTMVRHLKRCAEQVEKLERQVRNGNLRLFTAVNKLYKLQGGLTPKWNSCEERCVAALPKNYMD